MAQHKPHNSQNSNFVKGAGKGGSNKGGKSGKPYANHSKSKDTLDLDGGFMKRKVSGDKGSHGSNSKGGKPGNKPAGKGSHKNSAQGNGKTANRNQGGKTQGERNQNAKKPIGAKAKPQVPSSYNFNTCPNRRNTNSMKWNVEEDELPMWVADMDLMTAPAITNAIVDRAATGVYGYSDYDPNFKQTVCDWWQRRHHTAFNPEDVLFCNGIIPAIGSLIRTLTNPEDCVLVQPPVYNHFYNSIADNGRIIEESPLDYDGKYYFIDWEDLEERLSAPEVTMMIVCNPHNPIGKAWSREDLARIGELCDAHDVVVVSDEIHCDIMKPGVKHVPFASASDTCRDISITCGSPSKAFNTAGLQSAYVICPNEQLRSAVQEGMKIDDVAFPNTFAMDAIMTAYTKCDVWLDDLNKHIQSNKEEATHYIEQRFDEVVVVPSEATYLLWLDCMELATDATELCEAIRQETGLILSPGSIFGTTAEPFLRMNVACSKAQLQDALQRLDSFFNMYE